MGTRLGVSARLGFFAMIGALVLLEEVVRTISYGSSVGYDSVHADGAVCCTSKAFGDFSGQVCFVVA